MTVIDPHTPELLTVEQFAEYLQVSRTTVFYWLKNGDLLEGVHYFRIGRVLRFRWLEELFFRKKAPFSSKAKTKKRPTSPGRPTPYATAGVNLDYGATTA